MKSGIKYIMKCLENMKVKDKYEKDRGVYFKGPCENQTELYQKWLYEFSFYPMDD